MKNSGNAIPCKYDFSLFAQNIKVYRPGMLVLVKETFFITSKAKNSNGENCPDK